MLKNQRAYRIGKKFSYKDKEKLLLEYRSYKLLEEKLYINEDLSEETMEVRSQLFQQAKELRKNGKFAKVIHHVLPLEISLFSKIFLCLLIYLMPDKILQNLMQVVKNRNLFISF